MKFCYCTHHGWHTQVSSEEVPGALCGINLFGSTCEAKITEWKIVTDLPPTPEFRRSLPADFYAEISREALEVMAKGHCAHSVHMQGCGPCEAHAEWLKNMAHIRTLTEMVRETTESEWRTPCRMDHHGYCQEHGDFSEGECYVPRSERLVKELEEAYKDMGWFERV